MWSRDLVLDLVSGSLWATALAMGLVMAQQPLQGHRRRSNQLKAKSPK
jgi:hypothetical protein